MNCEKVYLKKCAIHKVQMTKGLKSKNNKVYARGDTDGDILTSL